MQVNSSAKNPIQWRSDRGPGEVFCWCTIAYPFFRVLPFEGKRGAGPILKEGDGDV